jgi:8-oxoguanine deaminase
MILFRDIYHLATMNDAGERLTNVNVLVDGPRIVDVGPGIAAPDGSRIIDCSSMLMIPGLVNLHHHFYQTLQRNIPPAQNRKLFDWLTTLYDIWAKLSRDDIRASTRLACAELLLTGCTMTSDQMYVFPSEAGTDLIDVEVHAAAGLGIRFHPTRGSMSRGRSEGGLPPDVVVQTADEILRDSERLIDAYHDSEPFAMTRIALSPCSPFSVDADLMRETAALARDRGVMLHTHLAETEDENAFCLKEYGVRPVGLMESLDWLGDDVWFAHCVHLDESELDLLAGTGTGVSHCPTSNMRLSSGVARVPEMLERGTKVGLGVDGSASNDSSDMLGELRNCLLAHLLTWGPRAITADEIARMATRGGAEVLGRPEIGTIEPGMAADLALFDMSRIGYAGALSDPLAAIMYAGFDHRASYTVVNGEIVVEEGRLVLASEEEIAADGNEASRRMLEAAGVDTSWMPQRD